MTRFTVFVGLISLLACSGLNAQTATAKVPFDFEVGKYTMPAGEYRIEYASGSPLLRLQSKDGKHGAWVVMIPLNRADDNKAGALIFNRYGDAYFLQTVWAPYSSRGGKVRPSTREDQLARSARPAKAGEVAVASR